MFDVLNYIHKNILKPLTSTQTAETFGYSKWHFCKKFHDFTNMTFSEYVRHYKIQLAAIEILQEKKVTDVAFSYGYDSLGGFNKAFLKEYGCLPREYKKQAKECQLYYERRQKSMCQLTDRVITLREEVVNEKKNEKYYGVQRNVYFALATEINDKSDLSIGEKYANAIAYTIEKFTPHIAPGELIVGFNYGEGKNYHESARPELAENPTQIMKENNISDEDIKRYLALSELQRKADFRYYTERKQPECTEAEKQANVEWAAQGVEWAAHNHSVIGYEKVLKLGFSGILDEILEFEKKNGENPFYNGLKIICEASMKIGEKYAQKAKELLKKENSEYNKDDLEIIAKTCSRVPKFPAESFMEAVQSLWLAHIINTWEDKINANSIGRLDQILYPYYKKDIESGKITKEEAFEMLCCLWLKLYRDYDVQQSCVGGTNSNGTSAVNELSYMMLDVTEKLDFIRCLSVRFSEKTDKEFIKRALEVVGHVQKGVPFFFNDDVMIPALVNAGVKYEDACGYTQIGCVETVIPGKSNPHAVTGRVNLLKAIEYTFCNGRSMMHPDFAPGIETGDISNFTTFNKFYGAVIKQVDNLIEYTCKSVSEIYDTYLQPKPYKSLLTEGCLENVKDYNDKGAIYDYYQIMIAGVPNFADSMMAIKKLVFDEKKYTLEELVNILKEDYPDETVRLEFENKASKFGNDIDEVDSFAIDIINHTCDKLEENSKKYNIAFHAQPFTFLWMIDHGHNCAASADGRRAGEPIAYSISPMQGRDFNGLSAVLKSISKLPTKRTPGTTSAIIEVDPKLFTDRNIGILTDALISAGKMGLSNVQFNTIDADTLTDAKKHPEKYKNLAVRVSGFSQKFNLLSSELQDHIIGRTKHSYL